MIVPIAGIALLLALAAAVLWQERRRIPEGSIVYGVEDSILYVRQRLSDEARAALKSSDVRRILEWSVRYLQDPDVRAASENPPVAGGLEAAQYVQDRSFEAGFAYDGDLILEVLKAQNEYLAALGALGSPVADQETADGEESGRR